MTRGRKPIEVFNQKELHINEMATTATNSGAYTVESLAPGLCYFLEGQTVVVASSNGYMKVHLTVAEIIADELPQILADYKADRKNGLVQMSTRDIQRMLEL